MSLRGRESVDPMSPAKTLRLLTHPVRIEILRELGRSEDARSPRELTDALPDGESLGVVAYHVRTLANAGMLRLVRESRVRGAVEHFYRPTPEALDLVVAADGLAAALDRARATLAAGAS